MTGLSPVDSWLIAGIILVTVCAIAFVGFRDLNRFLDERASRRDYPERWQAHRRWFR